MAMRLAHWIPRSGGEERLYVNGIPNAARFDKVWLQPSDYPLVHHYGAASPIIDAAVEFLRQWPTWHDALRAAQGNPASPDSPAPDRAEFDRAHIAHVSSAARMVGIAFRNGLGKAEIIERILKSGHAAQALQYVRQLQAGNIPKPEPLKPAQAADWITDDDAPSPTPAPVQPPVAPMAPAGDYVTRPEHAAACKRLADQAAAIGVHAGQRIDTLQAAVKALQDAQPLVIQFPERPAPIKVDGLTHPQFADMLLTLRAGMHCMLVGPAGSGKTYSAEQAAGALGRKFFMQGAVTYAHELLGYIDAHSRYVRTQFRDAFEHGGLILLDEFDASSAESALVLNAALANGACAFPDGLIRKHADFLCIIGANTDGSGATMAYAGRARLDGAFLDRFVVFDWQIDPRIEESMAQGNTLWLAAVRAVREFARARGILDVVATPRATSRGAILCEAGMARGLILARTCKRGALVECWREVEALPAVAAFLRG